MEGLGIQSVIHSFIRIANKGKEEAINDSGASKEMIT